MRCFFLALTVALLALSTPRLALAASLEGPTGAGSATEPTPAWLHALAKTVTYESVASIDALVVGLWWSGDGFTGGLFAGLSAATAATAYYLHELAWNALGPDPNTADPEMLGLWKTITYRIVSGSRVLGLTYLLTGSVLVSGSYVVINTVLDALIYYGNDLAWAYFGPPVKHLGRRS